MPTLGLVNCSLRVQQDCSGGRFAVLDSRNRKEWRLHGPEIVLHFWNVGEERHTSQNLYWTHIPA